MAILSIQGAAKHLDRTRVRCDQAADQTQQCGFTHARTAHQGDHRTTRNLKGHSVDHATFPVTKMKISEGNNRHGFGGKGGGYGQSDFILLRFAAQYFFGHGQTLGGSPHHHDIVGSEHHRIIYGNSLTAAPNAVDLHAECR